MLLINSNLVKKLKERKDLQRIVVNTGWLFSGRILRMAINLFIGVWVARYLGVERFGLLSYAIAFVTLFSTCANLGLPSLVIRTITHEAEQTKQILGTTFLLQLIAGIVTSLFAIATVSALRQGDQLSISLVSILVSVTLFRAFETIDLWFQSQIQSKYTVLAKNSAFIMISMVNVILIIIEAPLLAFAVASATEIIISSIGLIWIYRIKGYTPLMWQFSLPLARKLLTESWPLVLSGLAVIIYMKIDLVMLGEMVSPQEVGIYSSAARISEVSYFIPTALTSSFAPSIYAAKKNGSETSYYNRIKKLLKILSVISVSISIPITFFANSIIITLFGRNYEAAAMILSIHIWASFFVAMGVGTGAWYIAEGLTFLSFRRTLIGVVTNILLNLVLIPRYGGVGAAIATVVSYSISGFFGNGIDRRTKKIFQTQLGALSIM